MTAIDKSEHPYFFGLPQLVARVFAVLVGLTAVWYAVRFTQGVGGIGLQEDALIGMRHLRNFLEGNGLYYNADRAVIGVTSPMFWLLSSALVRLQMLLGLEGTLIQLHLHATLAMYAGALCLNAFAQRDPKAALIGQVVLCAALVLFTWQLRFLVLGLEGAMILLALVVLIAVAARAPTAWTAAVLALLSWVRPELAVISLVATGYYLIVTSREGRARIAGAYVAAFSVQPVLLTIFTGSPIPQSVIGKASFGRSGDDGNLLAGVQAHLTQIDQFLGWGSGVAAALATASLLLGAYRAANALISQSSDVSWTRGVLTAILAGYTLFIMFTPALWEWYISFWLLVAIFTFSLEIASLLAISTLFKDGQAESTWRFVALIFLVSGVALGRLSGVRDENARIRGWLEEEMSLRGRIGHELATRWVAQSVWMEAVGWQGYFNRSFIIDEVGLVSSETAPVAKAAKCSYFVEAIRQLRPQFVVKRQFEIEENRLMTPPNDCPNAPLFPTGADRQWFDANYVEVERYAPRTEGYFGQYSPLLLFKAR